MNYKSTLPNDDLGGAISTARPRARFDVLNHGKPFMNMTSKIVAASLGVALIAGCASAGNERMKSQTQSSIASQMTEGTTTKTQVEANLGSPSTVSFTDSGNEIWTYKYAHATSHAINFVPVVNLFARGADVNTKELVILFSKDSVVTKYTMRESQNVVKAGIAE
jgi:outer membrane protein assembly factor BamE (lipoprotein component of BamABCDE complex)